MSPSTLFVVWPNGRRLRDDTVGLVAEHFQIADVTEVVWSEDRTPVNYSRFHRTSLEAPFATHLAKRLGVGPALVITTSTVAADEETADLVRRLSMGDLFYISDNVDRDLMLLVGESPGSLPPVWSGTVRRRRRDLTGAGGWDDPAQLFAVLNTGSPYVVLRNFDTLADLSFPPGHNDIDILTADYHDTVALADLRSRLGVVPRWGGRFDARIGGRKIICDLRFPGDGYYDRAWAEEILRSRRRHPDGFYVPSDDQYLDSLLYHAVVHKPFMRADYRERLARLASEQGRNGWDPAVLSGPRAGFDLLTGILARRGYRIRRPKDPTVSFNHRLRVPWAPLIPRTADAVRRRIYRWTLRRVLHPLRRAARRHLRPT